MPTYDNPWIISCECMNVCCLEYACCEKHRMPTS